MFIHAHKSIKMQGRHETYPSDVLKVFKLHFLDRLMQFKET